MYMFILFLPFSPKHFPSVLLIFFLCFTGTTVHAGLKTVISPTSVFELIRLQTWTTMPDLILIF